MVCGICGIEDVDDGRGPVRLLLTVVDDARGTRDDVDTELVVEVGDAEFDDDEVGLVG